MLLFSTVCKGNLQVVVGVFYHRVVILRGCTFRGGWLRGKTQGFILVWATQERNTLRPVRAAHVFRACFP